jgi:hypothetical protein
VNEDVPRSSRARGATVSLTRGAGKALHSLWDWFTDLGAGAWVLGLGVLVGGALLVAVIQGRSGPEQTACQQARPYVETISQMDLGRPLTLVQAQRLHNASSQLTALARTGFGANKHAITDAARISGGAQAGQPFSAGDTIDEFQSACPNGLSG